MGPQDPLGALAESEAAGLRRGHVAAQASQFTSKCQRKSCGRPAHGTPKGTTGGSSGALKQPASSELLRTVVLEKTPESPFGVKEIKPVNLRGNQP